MWHLIVSVPDHCLSFYFTMLFIGMPVEFYATYFADMFMT